MSLSNILLQNNPVSPQPWTNLTCQSITANSITTFSTVNSPTVAATLNPEMTSGGPPLNQQLLPIGLALNSVTNGVLFNFTAPLSAASLIYNLSPTYITDQNVAANGAIGLKDAGLYNIFVNLLDIETVGADSGSEVYMLLKYSIDSGASFSELFQTPGVAIAPATDGDFTIEQSIYFAQPNTQLQIIFKRATAAVAAGSIVISNNSQSIIKITRVT